VVQYSTSVDAVNQQEKRHTSSNDSGVSCLPKIPLSLPRHAPKNYLLKPSPGRRAAWACHTSHICTNFSEVSQVPEIIESEKIKNNKKSLRKLTLRIHKDSVIVEIDRGGIVAGKNETGGRGEILKFSYEAEKRMRLMLEDTADVWNFMAGVTYPAEFPTDGKRVKKNIHALKEWFKRQGVKDIAWCLEFQARGAPHVHFLLSSDVDKEKFSAAWYKIVGSGDLLHLAAGTSIEPVRSKEKARTYFLSYARKRKQKDVPENFKNVGRFWGCTRKAEELATYVYRYPTEEALMHGVVPVVEYYGGKMAEWSKGKPEPYTWSFKGNSFICWGGAEAITKMIEEGAFNDMG
jgi:hypothetical protein